MRKVSLSNAALFMVATSVGSAASAGSYIEIVDVLELPAARRDMLAPPPRRASRVAARLSAAARRRHGMITSPLAPSTRRRCPPSLVKNSACGRVTSTTLPPFGCRALAAKLRRELAVLEALDPRVVAAADAVHALRRRRRPLRARHRRQRFLRLLRGAILECDVDREPAADEHECAKMMRKVRIVQNEKRKVKTKSVDQ